MQQTNELINNSFSDYLSRPEWAWSWFVTATFDFKRYPYATDNLCKCSWNFFLNRIAEHSRLAYGFAFAESHKSGRRHWHALVHVTMNNLGQPRRDTIWNEMKQQYGRCEIRGFRPSNWQLKGSQVATISNGVSRYLTKYVAKESSTGQAWWDFDGIRNGLPADSRQIADAIGLPGTGN